MKTRTVLAIALVLGLGAAGGAGAAPRDPLAVALPQMRVMPGMETRWIAARMAWNGLPMSVRLFRTTASPQAVLAWYERLWSRRGQGEVVRRRQGPWRVIGHRDERHYRTVRVRAVPGGAEGLLTISPRPERVRPLRRVEGLPLPGDLRVLHRIDSLDGTRRAWSYTLASPYGAEATLRRIRDGLVRAGWVEQPESLVRHRATVQQAFQREAWLCQVSVRPATKGSLVLVHLVQ